ncbi:MAG: hypothetical protein R6V32_09820 [Bacteroidales bacterium]
MQRRTTVLVCFLTVLLLYCVYGKAQDDSVKMVKYSLSYDFNEGIYLDFNQFRQNTPIDFSSTNLPDPEKTDPGEAMLSAGKLSYFDDYGIKQQIPIDSLWGYCYNSKIYVYWSGGFHLLPYIGKISHFVAKVQVRHNNRADPFYDPNYVYTGPSSYVSNHNMQMLLNIEDGGIYKFEPENVLKLIKDEPELYEEFSNLKKRKQRKMMFYYIRQYNEKQALYFPAD